MHVLYAAMSYLLSILYGLFRRKRMSANERGERPCDMCDIAGRERRRGNGMGKSF